MEENGEDKEENCKRRKIYNVIMEGNENEKMTFYIIIYLFIFLFFYLFIYF